MTAVSRGLDRVEVIFDDPSLVADAGLMVMLATNPPAGCYYVSLVLEENVSGTWTERDYGTFSREIAALTKNQGIRLRELLPEDESLESVFAYLIDTDGPKAR